MKTAKFFALSTLAVFSLMLFVPYLATANPLKVPGGGPLNSTRPNAPWIKFWWALDGPITNNGGHGAAACKDWLDLGTKGKLKDAGASTLQGLQLTRDISVNIDKGNGGPFKWTAIEINPADTHNMSTAYGLGDQSNISTYAIIVITAPDDMTAVMSTAHDDHATVFVNGEVVYSNPNWTEGVNQVDYEVDINLNKGGNVLLFRCDETGGDDHFNLHFDDATNDDVDIYPTSKDANKFWRDIAGALPVDPKEKMATTWGRIKKNE